MQQTLRCLTCYSATIPVQRASARLVTLTLLSRWVPLVLPATKGCLAGQISTCLSITVKRRRALVQVRALTGLNKCKAWAVWDAAVQEARCGGRSVSGSLVAQAIKIIKSLLSHPFFSCDTLQYSSDKWYTPTHIIRLVRQVLKAGKLPWTLAVAVPHRKLASTTHSHIQQ